MNFYNEKNQIIGELKNDTFYKTVRGSVHFMRTLNSWGIDNSVVEQLRGRCNWIEIYDSESKSRYRIRYEDFLKYSFTPNFNYGHGIQSFLRKKYWELVDPNQIRLL